MFISTTAFIIGNGKSRQALDLEPLKRYGYTIGCNALVRDFTPDYIVALDRKMETEIRASGYSGRCLFRQDTGSKKPREPNRIKIASKQTVNSGLAAIYSALKLNCRDLWLIGFDLTQQNVYAGTANYSRFSAKAEGAPPARVNIHQTLGKWAHQLQPKVNFYRVYDSEYCYNPREWEGVIKNVEIPEFKKLWGLK